MTLEFAPESQRPAYIGLSNTLIAPATFIAPIFAGILIDKTSYDLTFLASGIAGLLTLLVLILAVKDPRRREKVQAEISPTD
jgi:MFS family permease